MQDWQLLQEFVKTDSQEAFGQLVERHLNLVYSTCLREVGDSGLAEDATQVVFLLLSQKAGTLRPGTIITGWLFHTARFVAKNARKQDIRWRHRTQKVAEAMMHEATTNAPETDETWSQIEPLLHEAISTLNTNDRNAVLLRCFEGRTLKETGAAMGVTEEAARKRVARALDKLRNYFTRHGFTLSAATLAVLLNDYAVQAAPASLSAALGTAFCASTGSMAAGGISAKVITLTECAKRAWLLGKIKIAASVVCGVSLIGLGTERLTHQIVPSQTAPPIIKTSVSLNNQQNQPRLAAKIKKPTAKVQRPKTETRPLANVPQMRPVMPSQKPLSSMEPRKIAPKASAVATQAEKTPIISPVEKTEDGAPDDVSDKVLTREEIQTLPVNERNQDMNLKKTMVSALVGATMAASALAPQAGLAAEGDKGTINGLLTGKGENWIEVRADDAKESKRYIPNWIGGAPKDGGGADKATIEAIKKLRVPNRVKLDWAFTEHLRIVSVEMLEPKEKSGVIEGTVTAKGENWIEVKSGDAPTERYSPRWAEGGPDKDALRAIRESAVGDKVRIEWAYAERLRIVSLKKQ